MNDEDQTTPNLPNPQPPTNREIFDKVKDHLLTQRKQALRPDGGCVYRGRDGSMCAVGCLITDEFYHMDLENYNVGAEKVFDAVLLSLGFPEAAYGEYDELLYMLESLQSIHDHESPELWSEALNALESELFPEDDS